MRYTINDLKEEEWYKALPENVKDAVHESPPVFLYRRKYAAGFWMITGYTEGAEPDLIIEPRERAGKDNPKTHASITSHRFLTPVCWHCKEPADKQELLENETWCKNCNTNHE